MLTSAVSEAHREDEIANEWEIEQHTLSSPSCFAQLSREILLKWFIKSEPDFNVASFD